MRTAFVILLLTLALAQNELKYLDSQDSSVSVEKLIEKFTELQPEVYRKVFQHFIVEKIANWKAEKISQNNIREKVLQLLTDATGPLLDQLSEYMRKKLFDRLCTYLTRQKWVLQQNHFKKKFVLVHKIFTQLSTYTIYSLIDSIDDTNLYSIDEYFIMQPQFRSKRYEPIFQRPKSRAKTLNKSRSNASVQLPNIYTRQLKHKIPQLVISNQIGVRRQIGKIVSFKKDKITCLLPELYRLLPEEIKPVGYSSQIYREKLEVVNLILGSCDLNVKEREVMIARGQQSQAIYVFFTNFIYHPISLCCDQTVVLKCVEKTGIQIQQVKKSNKWQFICIQCLKVLLKLNQNEQKSQKTQQIHIRKRKLLDFALHIASGRYKKHLLQQDPVTLSYQHVKSRFKYIKPRKITQTALQ